MNEHTEERRSSQEARILAVSRDHDWLHFAKKILRRNDQVEILDTLSEAANHPADGNLQTVLFISSELVPSKIKEFEELLEACSPWRTWVLNESHDTHQRINDKHLRDMGVLVDDRPDNAKAMRRLLKKVFA